MKINNKLYDILKWVAQIVLPALGAAYFGLASIWGFPYGEQVVGTITVLDTFLGALLGISSIKYEGDGVLTVNTEDENKDIYHLSLTTPIEDLPKKNCVVFKTEKK